MKLEACCSRQSVPNYFGPACERPVAQHYLLNYSFYISRMPVITTDPRTNSLAAPGPAFYWQLVQGSVLVARGRPTPIFTVDFREFLTHTLDIARPEAGANLVTDPRSIDGVHIWTPKRTMDQGSVVVLCRRGVVFIVKVLSPLQSQFSELATCTIAVKIPQCTTSDPRSNSVSLPISSSRFRRT